MNSLQLVSAVSGKTGLSKNATLATIKTAIEVIRKSVSKGGKVKLAGLGVFERTTRGKRVGRNPKTGEVIQIKATKHPKFRPGKDFRELVRQASKSNSRIAKKAPALKAAARLKSKTKRVIKKTRG